MHQTHGSSSIANRTFVHLASGINAFTRSPALVASRRSDRPAHEAALRSNLLSPTTTKARHVGGDPKIVLYAPDLSTDKYAFLNSPEQAQIYSGLFYDHRTNVDAYLKWWARMQKTQPSFRLSGTSVISYLISESRNASARMSRMPKFTCSTPATLAQDAKADKIAALVREFMKNRNNRAPFGPLEPASLKAALRVD